MSVAPGDLIFIRYLDLPGGPSAAYQVIAVYDDRMWYFHLGHLHIYNIDVDVLNEKGIEVSVHRL